MQAPILVATDFSPLAGFALERAAMLARERRCPLHVVHVRDASPVDALRDLLQALPGRSAAAAASERLHELARSTAGPHGLPATGISEVSGRASVAITACAQQVGAGLVVLGAHGAGILRDLALGGTAIKVLRTSPCPVLVVRREPVRAYETIVAGTDLSATAVRAVRAALDMFADASLVVVSACPASMEGRLRLAGASAEDITRYREQEVEEAKGRLVGFAAQLGGGRQEEVRTRVRLGHAAAVLIDEVRQLDASLLVVGRHGGSAMSERLLGSVTLNVLHHAPCDVLMVP